MTIRDALERATEFGVATINNQTICDELAASGYADVDDDGLCFINPKGREYLASVRPDARRTDGVYTKVRDCGQCNVPGVAVRWDAMWSRYWCRHCDQVRECAR